MREALVRIDDRDFAVLGIEELVETARSAGIREFDELACHGDSSAIKVEVGERMDEPTLEALEYVDDWDRVAADGESCVYVISFVAPGLSGDVAEAAADLVGTCDPAVGDRGATMTLTGPQDAVAGAVDGYEAEGVAPELRKSAGTTAAGTRSGS